MINCPNCNEAIENAIWTGTNKHHLTPGLVITLMKFGRAVRENGKNSLHLMRDIQDPAYQLNHTEMANFQKLRYWGLVHKPNKHRTGRTVAKDGIWLLTRLGAQFLRGEVDVPIDVFTVQNTKTGESIELVNIKFYQRKKSEFQTLWPVLPPVEKKEYQQGFAFTE